MKRTDLHSYVEATERKIVAKEWAAAAPEILKLLGFATFCLPALLRAQQISLRRYHSALALALASVAVGIYSIVSPWVDNDPIHGLVHILLNKPYIDPIQFPFESFLNGAIGVGVWQLLAFALTITSRRLLHGATEGRCAV